MAYYHGTHVDPFLDVESVVLINELNDTETMANAPFYGKDIANSLTIGITSGSNIVTQSAASLANVGELITISTSTADDGIYLIRNAVANTSYTIVDSNGVAFSASNTETAVGAIHEIPSLKSDINFLQTQAHRMLKNATGNYYDELPTYANQGDTTINVPIHLDLLKDAHNKYQNRAIDIVANNGGAGYTIVNNDVGDTVLDTTPYTDATRNTGIPTLDGTGTPDATNFNLTYVTILDHATGEPVAAENGDLVFGRLVNGTTVGQGMGGTGELTDVAIRFLTGTNDGSATPFIWNTLTNPSLPATVDYIYHHVVTIYDAPRNNMLGMHTPSGYILSGGDAEQNDNIRDIQEFIGCQGVNVTTPTITNNTSFYPLSNASLGGLAESLDVTDTDLCKLINVLNNQIGNLTFGPDANIILTGNGDTDTITDMLAKMAQYIIDNLGGIKISMVNDGTAGHGSLTGSKISRGTAINFPGTQTYRPNAVASVATGKFMDVYLRGRLMSPDYTDLDMDYEETSGGIIATTAGSITFHNTDVRSNDELILRIFSENN